MVKSLNKLVDPSAINGGIFYFTLILCFLSGFCFAQPQLTIKDNKFNFGFVRQGEQVKCEYGISNTGNQPLILVEVEISCSCTTAEYSKQPILPGQSSKVVVIFNTSSAIGRQDRVVILKSNSKTGETKLRYKGVVLKSKN